MEPAKISTRTPGRPSGVAPGARSPSIAASQPQAITEVAKPVRLVAAMRAQCSVGAVMTSAVARMSKASAKLSSIATPLRTSAGHDTLSNAPARGSTRGSTSNMACETP